MHTKEVQLFAKAFFLSFPAFFTVLFLSYGVVTHFRASFTW